jgi:hypothetical protein
MPSPRIVPARPPRDRRLDVLRGWMQLSIYVSHIVGTGFAWLIHAAWGLSDSSEQFVLLSGLGLGSVFALKSARDGFASAVRDLMRRVRRLYVIQLLVVAGFALVVFAIAPRIGLHDAASAMRWGFAAEDPAEATAGLLVMLYQPEFTGILPVFVWCMLLLPVFMALVARVGAWALLPSYLLWLGTQLFGWTLPGLGGTDLEFNPLAWQILFVTGAWCGRCALLAGVAVRLAEHLGLDQGLASELLFGKEHLSWPRLVHALALAWLIAAIVPRDPRWMAGPVGDALAAMGRHSLGVFAIGLFVSWGVTAALTLHPDQGHLLDAVLVPAGALLLVGFARFAERRRGLPRAVPGLAATT